MRHYFVPVTYIKFVLLLNLNDFRIFKNKYVLLFE